jgi:hypothetical protein
MEEQKKQEGARPNQNNVEKNTSPEQGRVAGSNQPAEEQKADISHVDRQEGQMDNGELGGNFNKTETKGA